MKIILGVSGCIAAYKSAIILRLLQAQDFEVFPVMTQSAQKFLTPLTLEKLSGNSVIAGLFQERSPGIEHIEVARQSDLLLVAPATANILAKFAHGIADDFLSTLYISTVTPTVVVPAMNVEMWRHPATQHNLQLLRDRGVLVVEPGSGYLACGEVGEGRLAEPEEVVKAVVDALKRRRTLTGKRVLVTAGPTIEDIDPVRYISNRSSGKMGYAIAREAQDRGARVRLVSGPTHLEPAEGLEVVRVRSSKEMAAAVLESSENSDIVVMAAAVSDFTPECTFEEKIKKAESTQEVLKLRRTTDVLEELGRRKRKGQYLVGFSAESEKIREHARIKIGQKRLDLIVANDISHDDRGFQSDRNQVIFIDAAGNEEEFALQSKDEVARNLWEKIEGELSIRPVAVNS